MIMDNRQLNKYIEKAIKIHGNKYDYSKSNAHSCKDKAIFICPIHGEFEQTWDNHVNGGSGCPKCAKCHKYTNEEWIEEASKKHNGKYDYSKTNYVKARDKVIVICHEKDEFGEEHGEFEIRAGNHIAGIGCPKCAKKYRPTTDEWIKKARKVHGDKYLYDKVSYNGSDKKVLITCPIHGDFWQEAASHLSGVGCPKCRGGVEMTTEEYIDRLKQVHGNRYDYSKVNYINAKEKIDIICSRHGVFRQLPYQHLQGKGCPKCGKQTSEGEDDIVNFIRERSDLVILRRERGILNGKELDIYLPQKCVAFEYNGLRWHSEQFGKDRFYHIAKTEECTSKGVKLFHIFEDEYLYHREVLFAKISRILGFDKSLPKIGARKCVVKKIDNKDAECFLNLNHIQGYCKSSIHLGAFYNNKLISVMSFTKYPNDEWCLERFASDIHYIVQGICSKIVKYFVGNYRCKELKTFLDRRWERSQLDNVYTKCGFTQDSILKPDYRYTDGHGKRLHKFNFRKQKLHKNTVFR